MSRFTDKARELRNADVHYNCAQSVVLPFAEVAGITEAQAMGFAANFGSGMKMASVCGAITGGLMVLGLCGVDDGPTINEYYAKLKERHDGFLDCANLLRINKEKGGQRKPHCDEMVYECVGMVEEILRAKGKISH